MRPSSSLEEESWRIVAKIYFTFGSLSTSANNFLISSSPLMPNARKSAVAATFLFLSILTEITPLYSVSNSSQAPLDGINLAPKNLLYRLDLDNEKNAPGLLMSWDMTTLSIPFIMKVPLWVIRGRSAIKSSCSFSWPVFLLTRPTFIFNGASWVIFLSMDVLSSYLGSSNLLNFKKKKKLLSLSPI